MNEKPYRLGILVGRFQAIHAGHVDMIRQAVQLCDTVGIFVGSSQESGTAKNPFTYETRREMLITLFGDSVKVFPLPDIGVGNTAKWGLYVLKNVRERFGREPDLLISGKETRRADWLNSEEGLSIAELYVPKTIDISATEMRRFLLENDEASWRKFTDERLWPMFDELRKIAAESKDCLETASI